MAMSDIINVPRILEPTASHGKLARASAIFDDDEGKFQSEVNAISIKGVTKVRHIDVNTLIVENPDENTQTDVIVVNDDSVDHTVGVSNVRYKTPDGELLIITVPVGGYAEFNFLNIGGTIYVRGV